MKITYFLRDISDCGGIQQMTVSIINELAMRGYECTVVSLFHKYSAPFFEINKSVTLLPLFEHSVDTKSSFIEIRRNASLWLNKINPDILVVQGTSYACYLTKHIWENIKVIVCEHAYYGLGHFGGLHSIGKHISIKKASAIVALTELDKAEYKKHSRSDTLIEAIYNPCMIKQPVPAYNITAKTIVSCGTLDKLKGFDKAIVVGSKVLPYYKDWKWEIYGDGKERENLQELIHEQHMDSQIILRGYSQDKAEIYSDKSINVITSSFEGFGLVIAEAMTYGLPGVSFSVKYGPLELIQNQIEGLTVEYNDLDGMAKCIQKLIEEEELRNRFSINAKKKARLFEVENIVAQWETLFRRVINS